MKIGFLFVLTVAFISQTLGQGWSPTSAPATNWSAIACSADGSKVVAAVKNSSDFDQLLPGPIYVSADAGTNWTLTTAPLLPWNAVACSADGTMISAAPQQFGQPIFISTNFGVSWLPSGSPTTNFWSSIASSAGGNTLAASYPAGGHVPGGVFTSTNGGASWTQYLHDLYSWPSVTCSAAGPLIVAAAGWASPGIYRSLDNGTTWTSTNSPAGFGSFWLRLSADGSRLIGASDAGEIYLSSDLGDAWQILLSTNLSWASIACSADAKMLIAAPSVSGQVYLSTNSGANWVGANLPSTNRIAVACSADGHRLFAAGSNGLIYSLQLIAMPQLEIHLTGSDVTLSWLIPSTPFVLQETPTLSNPAWMDVLAASSLNLTNLHREVVIPKAGTTKYYRLESRP